jgi:hypothetical protein
MQVTEGLQYYPDSDGDDIYPWLEQINLCQVLIHQFTCQPT